VAELRDKFMRAKGIVLTDYKGMTVTEMVGFREALRKSDIEYRVVKNTLAKIAAEETPAASVRDDFKGPVGIAISYDDPVMVAKEVLEFSKKIDNLDVTCGVVDGDFCGPEQLKAIAELPPREVLLGMIAGTMQAPLAKMGRLLNASLCSFIYALSALKDKKGDN
jgi:large subunit ribosomal protein L10